MPSKAFETGRCADMGRRSAVTRRRGASQIQVVDSPNQFKYSSEPATMGRTMNSGVS